MNLLVAVVGPSGAGKTTLVHAMAQCGGFELALEEHRRPFQTAFKADPAFGFANQMDYLVLRAEQERRLRQAARPGLVDGGLDLDFHGFTRLFHARGWLDDAQFDLCRRFYRLARELLPPPDLLVALSADAQTLQARLASRDRINIASPADGETLSSFVEEWLATLPSERILRVDAARESLDYGSCIPLIRERIEGLQAMQPERSLDAVALLVREYDEAVEYFTQKLGFLLLEDTDLGGGKRWVRIAPGRLGGAALLLARAVGSRQEAAVGNQGGGRVMFLLRSADFEADYEGMKARGVVFEEQPRREAYGRVAVFRDLYGNRWDLLGPP